MSKLAIIALSLGMLETASEEAVSVEVKKLQLAKETAENKSAELQVKLSAIITAEANALVDKAIALGLIPEALKDSQVASLETNFDAQKVVLQKLITDKEAATQQNGNHTAVREVILGAAGKGNATPQTNSENTFDYFQKHNAIELKRIRDNEPARYAQLAKDYEQGVRFSK